MIKAVEVVIANNEEEALKSTDIYKNNRAKLKKVGRGYYKKVPLSSKDITAALTGSPKFLSGGYPYVTNQVFLTEIEGVAGISIGETQNVGDIKWVTEYHIVLCGYGTILLKTTNKTEALLQVKSFTENHNHPCVVRVVKVASPNCIIAKTQINQQAKRYIIFGLFED